MTDHIADREKPWLRARVTVANGHVALHVYSTKAGLGVMPYLTAFDARVLAEHLLDSAREVEQA